MKVLLIHNPLGFRPITWLGLAIRIFTCSKWHHVVLLIRGYVVESLGGGVISTPYEVWQHKADRIVLPLRIPAGKEITDAAIEGVLNMPYGFFFLLVVAWNLIRTRWFGLPEKPGRDYKGVICSELLNLLLGLNKRYIVPGDFEYLPGFEAEPEYRTKRARRSKILKV